MYMCTHNMYVCTHVFVFVGSRVFLKQENDGWEEEEKQATYINPQTRK